MKFDFMQLCEDFRSKLCCLLLNFWFLDSTKIVFGTEEGLFSLDLTAKQDGEYVILAPLDVCLPVFTFSFFHVSWFCRLLSKQCCKENTNFCI